MTILKNYLFYVAQPYSLTILRPLQDLIRKKGDSVAWFFDSDQAGINFLRQDEQVLRSVAEVKAFNPCAVFVPGNVVPDFFPGVKVQVFHGLATDDTGKKGHYRIRGFFDLYCTRGPDETRKFQELAKRYGHFQVCETGWPKLDPLFVPDTQDDLRRQLGTERPIVLYASTFSPSLTSAATLYETIRRLATQGDWQWLVTLHPKMDAQTVDKYRQLAGPSLRFFESHEDILPLLKAADVMLCDTSSIAIEFQMLHKPLVTFCTRAPGPHLIDVTNENSLEGALLRALSRPPELMDATRKFVDRLHPSRDGLSCQRVLDAVDAVVAGGGEGLRSKPLNLLRRLKIRRQLGYYRFK